MATCSSAACWGPWKQHDAPQCQHYTVCPAEPLPRTREVLLSYMTPAPTSHHPPRLAMSFTTQAPGCLPLPGTRTSPPRPTRQRWCTACAPSSSAPRGCGCSPRKAAPSSSGGGNRASAGAAAASTAVATVASMSLELCIARLPAQQGACCACPADGHVAANRGPQTLLHTLRAPFSSSNRFSSPTAKPCPRRTSATPAAERCQAAEMSRLAKLQLPVHPCCTKVPPAQR